MSFMHVLQALFTPVMYEEKVFCREKDLEIITLSMKITFFFNNFYYVLPFRNMTIRINHAFLVLDIKIVPFQ